MKHCLTARRRTHGLFGKARMIDDGAGCRGSNRSGRTQAKTPATRSGRRLPPRAQRQLRRTAGARHQARALQRSARQRWRMRGGFGRCIKTGRISPALLEKYARVNAPRITPHRACAIKRRLRKDEYFVYDKSVIPAEGRGQAVGLCRPEKEAEKDTSSRKA